MEDPEERIEGDIESMGRFLGRAGCLLGLAMLLVGCASAGRDFQRPASQELVLGKTTYAELSQRLGPARNQSVSKVNDADLDMVTYSYAESGGRPLVVGVTPGRSLQLYFHKGVLVGHEFVSSFANDATDFDDGKVDAIQKGRTSRSQVVAMLGQPIGEYSPPMVKQEMGNRALGYYYVQVKVPGGFSQPRIHSKKLVVTVNAADVVTDVNFTSTGER